MVDSVVKCPRRTGSEAKIKVNLGTAFMARASPLAGSPRPVASLPCVLGQVRLKRFLLKVRWTVVQRLEWVAWEADGKALDPRDYLIKLWMSHVGCNRITGKEMYFFSLLYLKGKYHANLLSFQNPKMFVCQQKQRNNCEVCYILSPQCNKTVE